MTKHVRDDERSHTGNLYDAIDNNSKLYVTKHSNVEDILDALNNPLMLHFG